MGNIIFSLGDLSLNKSPLWLIIFKSHFLELKVMSILELTFLV